MFPDQALLLFRIAAAWPMARHHARLAKMTPVRGDHQKQTADGESDSRDDRPCSAQFELRDLCGGHPDASEQNE
jgi:hypothetical protein